MLAITKSTEAQQGQAGISKKAKSIPNINAEGKVLTPLTARLLSDCDRSSSTTADSLFIFNGTNVAGTVQQVVAGQQIALSAVVPGLSGNLFVQSQGWTSPSGSVTGGYCTAGNCIPLLPAGYAIPTGGCTIPLPLQTLPSDCAMAAPR